VRIVLRLRLDRTPVCELPPARASAVIKPIPAIGGIGAVLIRVRNQLNPCDQSHRFGNRDSLNVGNPSTDDSGFPSSLLGLYPQELHHECG